MLSGCFSFARLRGESKLCACGGLAGAQGDNLDGIPKVVICLEDTMRTLCIVVVAHLLLHTVHFLSRDFINERTLQVGDGGGGGA